MMIYEYKKHEIRDESEEEYIDVENYDGSVFIYNKHDELVGGADNLRQAKHVVNKMIEQDVKHESDIVWPIRKTVKK